MTLEEAKKILVSKGYELFVQGSAVKGRVGYPDKISDKFKEAYCMCTKEGFIPAIPYCNSVNPALHEAASEFNDALLDEQKKQIEELKAECTRLRCVVEKKENSISRLHFEKELLEQEVEKFKTGKLPTKYFDTALVDEQAKKIKYQSEKIAAYKKQFAHLAKVLHEKNNKIDMLRKTNSSILTKSVNLAMESDENKKSAKKYANKLADACVELRELKEKLANIVVKNVDAQALKSAESALAYKESFIERLKKEISKRAKTIREKDEVIKDLGEELAETKKAIISVRNGSKEYVDYGIEAEKMIQKMAKVIVNHEDMTPEDFGEYYRLANGERYMPHIPTPEISQEELIKIQEDVIKKCTMPPLTPVLDKVNGNGILDQMEKKPYPTEDNPEEIEIEDAVNEIREALKAHKTVIIESEPDEPIMKPMPSDFQKFVDKHFWELV